MLTLGYSTYGLRDQDLFDAVARLADIGYDTVEFTATEDWPADHANLDGEDRRRLVDRLREVGFPTPHLMDLSIRVRSAGDGRQATLDRLAATCQLASDLRHDDHAPVVKTVVGGETGNWDQQVDAIAADLLEIADVAAEYDVVFAAEPHVGTPLDDPEHAAELMDRAAHPNLGLALDIAHFPPAQFDTERVVRYCGPHAVSTHVEDTEVVDGEIRYHPAGTTGFDYAEYCKLLVDAGFEGPLTAEVASAIWNTPDYDPWQTAEFCYESLRGPVDAANRYASDGDAA